MSNEFYKHLHVGNVQKYDSEILVSNAIILTNIPTPSAIYSNLLNFSESGSTMLEIKNEVLGIIESNNEVFTSVADFKVALPSYIQLIDKLNSETISDLALFSSLEAQGNTGPSDESIWDNLIIHYIKNSESQLVELLQYALKIIQIKAKIADQSISNVTDLNESWKSSFIVLPAPLFPLPFSFQPPQVDETEPTSSEPNAIYTEIDSLSVLRSELSVAFSDQNEVLKTQVESLDEFRDNLLRGTNEQLETASNESVEYNVDSLYAKQVAFEAPEFLKSGGIASLSGGTSEQLSSLKIDLRKKTIPFTISLIDKKINDLMKQVEYKPKKQFVTNLGSVIMQIDQILLQQIICKNENRIDHCKLINQLNTNNPQTSLIQVLGTGYLNTIKRDLVRYETGEIAHIENILQGESKNKSHRNLKRTENFYESFSSKTEESETDQRSTERYELDNESSKISSSSTDLSAGVDVSASYGPVSVTAGLDYSSSSASVEATSQSVSLAKEVTNRAINRIKETVEERRSQLSINEIEIINEHGIDNSAGTDHINGFYYWVDKVYDLQVVNRGKRLMLEFMVPEPAAFHIFSKSTSSAEGVNVEKPIPPNEYSDDRLTTSLKSFTDITRDNYHFWAAVYGVQNIPIPPSDYETVSSSFVLDYVPGGKSWHDIAFNSLKVPTGYKADIGKLNIGFSSGNGRYIAGYLGNKRFSLSTGTMIPLVLPLDGERDLVPLSFRGHFTEYHMNVELFCSLTSEKEIGWQQQVYQSILTAYNQQLSDYENALSLLSINQGISIEGDNPLKNRETEKVELKKWGIEMLTLQRFGRFDAMKNASNGHPEIDFQDAYDEGKFVKFFEQSVEWNNMTYVFYPYFWGRKPSWTIAQQLDDADPLFSKFLQAGYARVVVPVHPKFTEAVLHFLSSGEIWNGADLPALDDDLYLSIVDEIKAAEDAVNGIDLGDPWEVRIPTNSVMLSSIIPVNLPGS